MLGLSCTCRQEPGAGTQELSVASLPRVPSLSALPLQWPAGLAATSAASPASVCRVQQGPTRIWRASSAAPRAPAATGRVWPVPATYLNVEASTSSLGEEARDGRGPRAGASPACQAPTTKAHMPGSDLQSLSPLPSVVCAVAQLGSTTSWVCPPICSMHLWCLWDIGRGLDSAYAVPSADRPTACTPPSRRWAERPSTHWSSSFTLHGSLELASGWWEKPSFVVVVVSFSKHNLVCKKHFHLCLH